MQQLQSDVHLLPETNQSLPVILRSVVARAMKTGKPDSTHTHILNYHDILLVTIKRHHGSCTCFSKLKSKAGTQTGSSSGSWYRLRYASFKASSADIRELGSSFSIWPIRRTAFALADGYSCCRLAGSFFGNTMRTQLQLHEVCITSKKHNLLTEDILT